MLMLFAECLNICCTDFIYFFIIRVPLVKLLSHCQYDLLRRYGAPVIHRTMIQGWIMVRDLRAWRASLAPWIILNKTLRGWNTPWAPTATQPGLAKTCSWLTQSSLMVSVIKVLRLTKIFSLHWHKYNQM